MKYLWLVASAGLFAALACQPALADSVRPWTGCYVGGHAGGLWGKTDHGVDGLPVQPAYQRDVTFSDFTAGAHLGCNYQISRWVFGVEGDLNWTPLDDRIEVYNDALTIQTYRDKMDRYGTVRGRIGVAEGRWHAFATAGIAFSNLEMSFNRFNIDTGILDKFPRKGGSGWVAGAGLEYSLSQDWFARVEYLHHRFDGGLLLSELGPYYVRANEPHVHVVRFGIARRFGTRP